MRQLHVIGRVLLLSLSTAAATLPTTTASASTVSPVVRCRGFDASDPLRVDSALHHYAWRRQSAWMVLGQGREDDPPRRRPHAVKRRRRAIRSSASAVSRPTALLDACWIRGGAKIAPVPAKGSSGPKSAAGGPVLGPITRRGNAEVRLMVPLVVRLDRLAEVGIKNILKQQEACTGAV